MNELQIKGKRGVPVCCTSCGHEFPQDPPFSVPCRQCGAKVGQYCKRPSGHSGPFVPFHAVRDIDALVAGGYDHDGNSKCGPNSKATRTKELVEQMKKTNPGFF